MTAIKIPKTPMKAKENLKLDNSATYPITGGPSENQENLHLTQSLKLRQVEHLGFSCNAIKCWNIGNT
jgi:hypothetical protein